MQVLFEQMPTYFSLITAVLPVLHLLEPYSFVGMQSLFCVHSGVGGATSEIEYDATVYSMSSRPVQSATSFALTL